MTNKETFVTFAKNNCRFDWEAAKSFYDGDEEKVIEALHRFYDGFVESLNELEPIFDSDSNVDIHPYTTEFHRELDYAASMGYERKYF